MGAGLQPGLQKVFGKAGRRCGRCLAFDLRVFNLVTDRKFGFNMSQHVFESSFNMNYSHLFFVHLGSQQILCVEALNLDGPTSLAQLHFPPL